MPDTNQKRNLKLPASLLIGSFTILLIVASLFNPKDNIAIIPLFFLLLWLIFFSFMLVILRVFKKAGNPRQKTWIGLISTFLVLFLMLKSTGEVRPADLLVLVLLASGLSLYVNRRL